MKAASRAKAGKEVLPSSDALADAIETVRAADAPLPEAHAATKAEAVASAVQRLQTAAAARAGSSPKAAAEAAASAVEALKAATARQSEAAATVGTASKTEEKATQASALPAKPIFFKAENTNCGFSHADPACWWDNQAFINRGSRYMTKTSRTEALGQCGQLCAEAGSGKCNGFKWQNSTCFFLLNPGCGVVSKQEADCYLRIEPQTVSASRVLNAPVPRNAEIQPHTSNVQDVPASHESALQANNTRLAALEEELLQLRRENAALKSHQDSGRGASTLTSSFFKAEDTHCGWSDDDNDCQEGNFAEVSDGARELRGADREKASRMCGEVCEKAGAECGGFMWKESTCYFRKNPHCGVRRKSGYDCYMKHSVQASKAKGVRAKDDVAVQGLIASMLQARKRVRHA